MKRSQRRLWIVPFTARPFCPTPIDAMDSCPLKPKVRGRYSYELNPNLILPAITITWPYSQILWDWEQMNIRIWRKVNSRQESRKRARCSRRWQIWDFALRRHLANSTKQRAWFWPIGSRTIMWKIWHHPQTGSTKRIGLYCTVLIRAGPSHGYR